MEEARKARAIDGCGEWVGKKEGYGWVDDVGRWASDSQSRFKSLDALETRRRRRRGLIMYRFTDNLRTIPIYIRRIPCNRNFESISADYTLKRLQSSYTLVFEPAD